MAPTLSTVVSLLALGTASASSETVDVAASLTHRQILKPTQAKHISERHSLHSIAELAKKHGVKVETSTDGPDYHQAGHDAGGGQRGGQYCKWAQFSFYDYPSKGGDAVASEASAEKNYSAESRVAPAAVAPVAAGEEGPAYSMYAYENTDYIGIKTDTCLRDYSYSFDPMGRITRSEHANTFSVRFTFKKGRQVLRFRYFDKRNGCNPSPNDMVLDIPLDYPSFINIDCIQDKDMNGIYLLGYNRHDDMCGMGYGDYGAQYYIPVKTHFHDRDLVSIDSADYSSFHSKWFMPFTPPAPSAAVGDEFDSWHHFECSGTKGLNQVTQPHNACMSKRDDGKENYYYYLGDLGGPSCAKYGDHYLFDTVCLDKRFKF